MYFHNRAQAGRMLAKRLTQYSHENTVVLALSPGAVIVGAQIAMQIHANLMLLLTENIYLPGETDALAAMSSAGTFSYNNMFTPGQLEEMVSEYQHYIDEKRIEKFREINRIMGKDGEIHKELLRHHVVILVSDGLANGFSIDIAADYLKRVVIKRLVIVSPLASIPAVDRMHLAGDELHCLSVTPNYMFTDHYYDDNTIPGVPDLLRVIKAISIHWQHDHNSGEVTLDSLKSVSAGA
ncbi:hypothetical protein BH23PAT1_BH23PAT1_0220 [soil metagenome]